MRTEMQGIVAHHRQRGGVTRGWSPRLDVIPALWRADSHCRMNDVAVNFLLFMNMRNYFGTGCGGIQQQQMAVTSMPCFRKPVSRYL